MRQGTKYKMDGVEQRSLVIEGIECRIPKETQTKKSPRQIQKGDTTPGSIDQVEESFPVWPRPIDNKGLPLDEVRRDEAPVSAVLAIASIVSHDKIVIVRNGHGAEGAIFDRVVPVLKGVAVIPIRVVE